MTPEGPLLAISTVHAVLDRNGLVNRTGRRPHLHRPTQNQPQLRIHKSASWDQKGELKKFVWGLVREFATRECEQDIEQLAAGDRDDPNYQSDSNRQ